MVLLSTIEDTVIVEYGSFLLAEFPEITRGWNPSGLDDATIQSAGTGSTYLFSGGTDHYPRVTIEVHTAEPAVPGEWERIDEVEEVFSVPTIRLYSVTSELGEHVIQLWGSGRWQIRAASSGRSRVQQLGEASFAHDVERWLIQLWPLDAPKD